MRRVHNCRLCCLQVEVFRKAAVLINPDGVAIHPKAFEKHGIHESRLQSCPRFKDLARDLQTFISGCDVCGYNIRQFDVPLLRCVATSIKQTATF
jgi:DNA polymerase III epsilon subunit-like protein